MVLEFKREMEICGADMFSGDRGSTSLGVNVLYK
jgi:hypothetical protein